MNEYPKIHTIFKRDLNTKRKTLIEGEYSLPEFEYLANNNWVFTEKVDGTNIRIMFDGETITFGGKTDNAQIPATLVTKLNEKFLPQIDLFKQIFDNPACLYGEGYGPKIQSGGKYCSEVDFVLFDIKIGSWWLRRSDYCDIAAKLGIEVVPIIGSGTLADAVNAVKDGLSSAWGNFEAEGIVAFPDVPLRNRKGERIITKIKCRDFKSNHS